MKAIHKEIYDIFASNYQIYLNYYWASKIQVESDKIHSFYEKMNGVIDWYFFIRKYPQLNQYTKNPNRYSTKKRDKFLKTSRKKIIGIAVKNNKKTIYKSISEAASSIGRPAGVGNISAKLDSGLVAYGCKWYNYKSIKNK